MTAVPVGEAAWQETVIACARATGWRVAHFRPARTERGWRTAVAAHGAGFVDLVLVRDRVVFAELKSATGRLSPDQAEWRDALVAAGAEWHCWKPGDWDDVVATLKATSARERRSDAPVGRS